MAENQMIGDIKECCTSSLDGEGKPVLSISFANERKLTEKLNISLNELEQIALQHHIVPERYARNIGTTTMEGQLKLLKSKVAIIGAGGLGGTIVEFLARMGLGTLVVVDGDCFSENNLNRQLLSSENNIGVNKAKVAAQRIKEVNSSVNAVTYEEYFTEDNGPMILKDCDMVVDALDNLTSRFVVWETAKKMNIPFVHGAIGGFSGQVATFFPEDEGLSLIYRNKLRKSDRGAEIELGNPAATPLMVAAWQIQEVVKYLTGHGSLLRHQMLYMDAARNVTQLIEF